jgi:hypothetical protein
MITPFQVYIVMQLDSILAVSILISVLTSIACAILGFVYLAEGGSRVLRFLKGIGALLILSLAMCAFLPGSKTVAAMYILPKLATTENVAEMSTEAKELYKLAKACLKNLADEPEETK